jgi:hypothetical protein
MYKSLRISKYVWLVFYWHSELTPIQQNKGRFCVHKFANARDTHIYLGPICVGIEELRDDHFRPVRLSKEQ